MPYPWECIDCTWLDPKDTKWGEAYCKYNHYYVKPNSPSCGHLNKKSSGGCYLTTCMCDILGFEDHCKTLDRLRDFRDGYMKNDSECTGLLNDYDVVGPMICEKLLVDENKTRTAHIMLIDYINPAINSINNNDYDNAIEIYKDMTTSLMDHYGIDRGLLTSEKIIGINRQIKIESLV